MIANDLILNALNHFKHNLWVTLDKDENPIFGGIRKDLLKKQVVMVNEAIALRIKELRGRE